MIEPYRIAIAQYPIEFLEDFSAYEQKVRRWVADAAGQGASLLLFPEYSMMELVSVLPEETRKSLEGTVHALTAYWDQWEALFMNLAREFQVHILAGSFPRAHKNVAAFYGPEGKIGEQEKLIMTRFENEEWFIKPGSGSRVFDTELGRIGVAICYDSEFPLLVRHLVQEGADLILVPSCTESFSGYHRVKIGCQARALENQCYVAHSPTVGDAPWSPATDINIGAAALYGPPDYGFDFTGILEQGEMNVPCWVYAQIDIQKVIDVRRNGRVFNYADWDLQKRALGGLVD
ncbi:MAG TPA: carbon-nitrogen hydrolase family protein [Alphaproteobacteria bacterium]|nr:carbon-nitrogen hydrolase family protein [Alphaproteobacteria bacterium]HOO51394.1 carbon-nitrogen hydrolase family protein [Alphaproteobacteria bacterium]